MRSMRVIARVEHEHTAAQDLILDRLDVARADAEQGVCVDRQLRRGGGEHRTMRCAHWRRPVASSKPEFSLPTMNSRFPA